MNTQASMSGIKMVDLHSQYLKIKSEIDTAIQGVIESTAFIKGPQVKSFEEALANYLNADYVISCANGTDALQIALMSLDVKPGDEIILPAHTYIATAEVVALLGLTPVLVDVDPISFNLDINGLEKALSRKSRVIIPVHLYGQCANMEAITEFANIHNLRVIEDAAQSLGAIFSYKNGEVVKSGTIGDMGATSFFPSKNLGCFGDGGAIITNDPELAKRCRLIANHGQSTKYYHDEIGCNSRLDTIQASILNVKLPYLNEFITSRQRAAEFYNKALSEISQVVTPQTSPFTTHTFHQYTIRLSKRDLVKKHLASRGVPSMIYYPLPLHKQLAYKDLVKCPVSLSVSEALSDTVLSLPIHSELDTSTQSYIIESVKDAVKQYCI